MKAFGRRIIQPRVQQGGLLIFFPDHDMNEISPDDGLAIASLLAAILDMDRSVHAEFGLSLLSHEFRLIAQLFGKGRSTVKDATLSSRLSSRAFYELLKRMTADGLVRMGPHPVDGRAKSIRLDEAFGARLIARLKAHADPAGRGRPNPAEPAGSRPNGRG